MNEPIRTLLLKDASGVERLVPPADPAHTHEGEATRTAYDSLVRLVRTD